MLEELGQAGVDAAESWASDESQHDPLAGPVNAAMLSSNGWDSLSRPR